jgi:hypothetical protein
MKSTQIATITSAKLTPGVRTGQNRHEAVLQLTTGRDDRFPYDSFKSVAVGLWFEIHEGTLLESCGLMFMPISCPARRW